MRRHSLTVALGLWLALCALLVALLLTGCTPAWRHPRGVSERQWAADQFECKAIASGYGRLDTGHLSGPIGGPPGFGTGFAQGVATGSVLAAARERRELFELCLQAKGYVQD
jgi:hypothetical protein